MSTVKNPNWDNLVADLVALANEIPRLAALIQALINDLAGSASRRRLARGRHLMTGERLSSGPKTDHCCDHCVDLLQDQQQALIQALTQNLLLLDCLSRDHPPDEK